MRLAKEQGLSLTGLDGLLKQNKRLAAVFADEQNPQREAVFTDEDHIDVEVTERDYQDLVAA